MKRILLFTLLISIIGYSQNPIQPNHPNFEEGLPQDLVEKMKPFDLEFKDDEMMDSNPIGRVNGMKPQSFQKPGIVQEDEFGLRIFHYQSGTFSSENKQPETQYERFYNEDENITLEINDIWDIETQSYVLFGKKEYTYDENGNRTLYINYNWDTITQSFVYTDKTENIYDENGNKVMYSDNSNWDTVNQLWGNGSKSEYSFDENGNQTLNIRYNWDTESQSFVYTSKSEFYYDENGNPTLSVEYRWDTESQSFVYNR
jgi:hypothetical protein